ncbi:biotin-dependent carboxyltransferase family protein [Alteromonas sp. C1M14]|uniref:5-oxoprolinase subunit C family protein n=1 Tax=Alteromonas sp. C1M14 TaxID=2841567 RepID=UPI001C083D3D|nr:biotin-dependent carboxyltransferase family protein [Alteromonas sp. C1M14]MBU2976746.1 biotin-dependent carboxyltransferase family protein [Alteromonas sp. C1M14]
MNNNEITIEHIQMRSLVVDNGRLSGQSEGFSEAGAMDNQAFQLANYLAANPMNTPGLEVLGSITLLFHCDATIAVCGPSCLLTINDTPSDTWCSIDIKCGQKVTISSEKLGHRAYVGIHGNWDIPHIHGSACTVMREQLGGLTGQGNALASQDRIGGQFRLSQQQKKLSEQQRPNYSLVEPFDVVAGYQQRGFSAYALALFYASEYQLSPQCDRMGYRLSGPKISANSKAMRSEGINLGSVQVPGDGQPIIMMRDRQTLGGYPKIGAVASYDIYRLAQAVPGDVISFRPVDMNNARGTWLLKQRIFSHLTKG